jgi:hypothetical protein
LQQVYSTRFVAALATSTVTQVYAVPAGHVAVVKGMTLAWNTTARIGGYFALFMMDANSLVWTFEIPASNRGSSSWSGTLTLPAGNGLRIQSTAVGSPYFQASGYLLTEAP